MAINKTFFTSKVSRRIVLLFVCCTLVPILLLAFISFNQVMKQLYNESELRLHRESKTFGMAVIERLFFLEAELKLISSNIRDIPEALINARLPGNDDRLRQHFKGLAFVNASGHYPLAIEDVQIEKELSPKQKQHLASGKTLVLVQNDYSHLSIYMITALDPKDFSQGLLYAEINSMYLWGLPEHNTLPPSTELCILDASGNTIFASTPIPTSFLEPLVRDKTNQSSGKFVWKSSEQEYIASYWSVFLEYMFLTPPWTVIISTSKAEVFSPMTQFKRIFPRIIFLSFLVVLLLSLIQIRRSLLPLEKLKEVTWKISMRKFESRVTINSGDEFEELATSFNKMAENLEKLFNAMTTRSEIDKCILSLLDTDTIISRVLADLKNFFSCNLISVAIVTTNSQNMLSTHYIDDRSNSPKCIDAVEISPENIKILSSKKEQIFHNSDGNLPGFLNPFINHRIKLFMVIPFLLQQKLSGMITLGYYDSSVNLDDDLIQARYLADQMTVSLTNTHLVRELEELNWGTLTALARTIDAKSPWTAGHSERVTALAVDIAKEMGVTSKELENLHRAGLLHDIGKIGVPAAILNKPGELTDDENRIVLEHPRKGELILEPIKAYADIAKFILHHHERFDGRGYPDGLSGEDISKEARILSLADGFDALVSDRPYRSGVKMEHAVQIIKEETGKQFDPKVVDAFLKVVDKQPKAG